MTEHHRDRRSSSAPSKVSERPLHPLWRVAIVFAAAAVIGVAIHQSVGALFDPGYTRAGHVARAITAFVLYVPLVVVARRVLDRRPLSGLGVSPLERAWGPLLLGMAAWLVPAAIGIALVVGVGWSQITLEGSVGALAAAVALRVVLVLIYEALPEELLFRGYLYHNLATVAPRWAAVAGQAVLFVLWGVIIGAAATADRVLLFFVFSVILGIIRVRTGTVWATVGFHLAFQTVAQVTGPAEALFAVSDLEALQTVAFGLLPFALGVLLVERFHRDAPGWLDREPDPTAMATTRTTA